MLKQKEILKEPYKFCMVPYCTNTTVSAPHKLYICVPHEPSIRNKWLKATNRNSKDITPTEVVYCCEDHFDLPNDVENWNKWRTLTNAKIILKPGVVPHRFGCQTNRSVKRKFKSDDIIKIGGNVPTAEGNIEEEIKVYKLIKYKIDISDDNTTTVEENPIYVDRKYEQFCINNDASSSSRQIKIANLQQVTAAIDAPIIIDEPEPNYLEKRIQANIKLLKDNSNFYIGIPDKYIFIIDLIKEELNIREREILLCLKKIRRDVNLLPLANDFGVTKTDAINCLVNILPDLARYFRRFIFWPKSDRIIKNLPRSFRRKWNNVESIINCLEITRPEPADNQTKFECWSPEKNKYIYRYLISSTPDGLINFVSVGFGGSRNDNYLMEKSGYVDVIPFDKAIMINEGFLNVDNLLHRKRTQIFWPSKIVEFKRDMYNKKHVELTKRNLSIKMCTEQVIKRFREFLIIYTNTCLHPRMTTFVDDIVVIIAGLMNLQNNLY